MRLPIPIELRELGVSNLQPIVLGLRLVWVAVLRLKVRVDECQMLATRRCDVNGQKALSAQSIELIYVPPRRNAGILNEFYFVNRPPLLDKNEKTAGPNRPSVVVVD